MDTQTLVPVNHPEHYTMYFDSSHNIDGARASVYFISPSGNKLYCVLLIHFRASNNVVEYKATLHGIRIAIELSVKHLMVFDDSALVINQLNKD
jgi:ribonuclease HI